MRSNRGTRLMRQSELEDGGGGALAVGVSEEALGVVIEVVGYQIELHT